MRACCYLKYAFCVNFSKKLAPQAKTFDILGKSDPFRNILLAKTHLLRNIWSSKTPPCFIIIPVPPNIKYPHPGLQLYLCFLNVYFHSGSDLQVRSQRQRFALLTFHRVSNFAQLMKMFMNIMENTHFLYICCCHLSQCPLYFKEGVR